MSRKKAPLLKFSPWEGDAQVGTADKEEGRVCKPLFQDQSGLSPQTENLKLKLQVDTTIYFC